MTPSAILALYICFRIKHFVSDFLLQTDWMALNKGKPGIEGYRALMSHCIVHAAGTLILMGVFAPSLWWLAVVDFLFHAMVDRFKGILTYQKGWQYNDRWFWWSFGLDQEAHNFTHLGYILIAIANQGIAL